MRSYGLLEGVSALNTPGTSVSSITSPAIAANQTGESRFLRWQQRLPGPLKRLDAGILSLLIVFVLTCPLLLAHPRVAFTDEIKYFSYLHSIAFDHDVDFTNEYKYFVDHAKDAATKQTNTTLYYRLDDNGKNAALNEKGIPNNEGPIGSALLWSPFYAVAHVVALAAKAVGLKVATDGLGTLYQLAVCIASLIYGFIGLLLSYLLARNFVPRFEAALAVITLWFGTGVLFYMDLAPAFSHANSLFMLALWLYVWNRTRGWNQRPDGEIVYVRTSATAPLGRSIKAWALLGLIGGIAACVREQDGVIMIIAAFEALFLYWRGLRKPLRVENLLTSERENGVAGIRSLRNLFVGNVALLVGTLVGFAPQLVIYEWLNGHLGPSKTVGDKISFFSLDTLTHFVRLLFDTDHGMFAWWPVTLLAVVGLAVVAVRRNTAKNRGESDGAETWRQPFIMLLFVAALVAELYIMGAFATWDQNGSYGPRRLIGLVPIFAVGLGALFYWLRLNMRLSRRWLVIIAALFIAWNLGLIFQFAVIRTTETRKNLDLPRVVHDQFTEMPARVIQEIDHLIFRGSKT